MIIQVDGLKLIGLGLFGVGVLVILVYVGIVWFIDKIRRRK